jgi:hypothetical protein
MSDTFWLECKILDIIKYGLNTYSVRTRNPIPPRDREPGVNAINKEEFIGLASQGRAPTRTRKTG